MTVAEPALRRLTTSALTGTWLNTNPLPREIARFEIEDAGEGLTIRADDRAPVSASVYGDRVDATAAMAFSARYDDIVLQANIKTGVLVVAMFIRGEEKSYFAREFYYRSAQ